MYICETQMPWASCERTSELSLSRQNQRAWPNAAERTSEWPQGAREKSWGRGRERIAETEAAKEVHVPDVFHADVSRADVKATLTSEARDAAAGVFRAHVSRADDNADRRRDHANCGGGVAGKRAEPAVDMYQRDLPRGDDRSSVSRKNHYKPDIFRGDDVTEVSRCVCVYQQGV